MPNPYPSLLERAQFALNNPDIQHTPADLREVIDGLLTILHNATTVDAVRRPILEALRAPGCAQCLAGKIDAGGTAHDCAYSHCSPKPDGFGVFALTAPGVYCLQSVTYLWREEASRAAARFIPSSDAHVRPLYAGDRS